MIGQIKKKIDKIDQECSKLLREYMKTGDEGARFRHQQLQDHRKLYSDLIEEYWKSFDS